MNMRMNLLFLAPGMQHTEEANFRTEVSRIASHFEQGFRTGAEQKIVEDLLVLQDQWRQAAGECEDHVQVAGREKLALTRGDPAFPGSDLTLGAVPISPAVIQVGDPIPRTEPCLIFTAHHDSTTPPHGHN